MKIMKKLEIRNLLPEVKYKKFKITRKENKEMRQTSHRGKYIR